MSRKILFAVIGLLAACILAFGALTAAAVVVAGPRLGDLLDNAMKPASAVVQRAEAVRPGIAVQNGAAQAQARTEAPGTAASAQAPAGTLEAVYERVNPSVVRVDNLARNQRLQGDLTLPQGEGSGFVWDSDGHIVTNDHVVRNADALQVTFWDGTVLDAELVGTDPDSDLAVIKVDPALVTLTPVERGSMDEVRVGQQVLAIGNPFGFEGTMTSGIVSAVGRSIPAVTGFSIPMAIQTDAAINPGNSGGPLLNVAGQVIGVNDQIQSTTGSSSGVGFAIPINIVERVVPALIQTGNYEHAYLGIEGGTFSKAWAEALGLPEDARGAYVLSVVRSGPAARAGIQAGSEDTEILLGIDGSGPVFLKRGGDLITAIDGQPVTKMDDLLAYLTEQASPGDTVQLTVIRDGGNQETVDVTLGSRPDQVAQ